jgi:hypothetical protein
MMNMTLFHRVTRIPQTAASGIAGTLGKRSGGVGGGSAPPTARSSDRYPARSGACTPLSPHPVQGVTPLAHHFGGPGCQNPLFPRPETMNDPFAIAYPSTLRASPPNSFARAPCEARAPISVITGREQAGRSPGKSATKPMKMQGARQILCIKESSASIRTLQRLFARRIDLDLVAVRRLGIGLQIAAYQRFDAIVLDLNFREEDPDRSLTSLKKHLP